MTILKKDAEDWPDYWPGKLKIPDDEDNWCIDADYFCKESDEDVFHIGELCSNQAAELVKCKICGGSNFNVGRGNYYTAIRCLECQWEVCIHDG